MLQMTQNVSPWYHRIQLQKMLTGLMTGLFGIVFLIFSVSVTELSEGIIRENVTDNMSIVVNQFDVYLNNHITSIYNGFRSLESDQGLVQLRTTLAGSSSLSRRASLRVQLKKLADQFQSANTVSVSNVYINFGDGFITTHAYDQDPLQIQYSYEEWRTRFPENKYYWINANSCRDLIPNPEIGVVLFHLYAGRTEAENGIILVALKQSFFDAALDSTEFDLDSDVCLLTEYGAMHFGGLEAGQKVDAHADTLAERASMAIKSDVLDDFYFAYRSMRVTDWILVYSVRESNISSAHFIVQNVILLGTGAMAISALLIFIISHAISRPLRVLSKKVEAEDVLQHKISVQSYIEISTLSNSLETMRCHINDLLKQIEMEQETKRKVEIALLQEQINPHFLYNTLYSIMQLCEMGRAEEASRMLEEFSRFYRIGLSRGENIVTVAEELEHIKSYLYIQHFRYADLFDYSIDCEPELLNCLIPKMSLQPIVENAIYHGIKEKGAFCSLAILGGTFDDEHAYLEVRDDGAGITAERLCDLQEQFRTGKVTGKPSFGLKNVDARIKYEFGPEYGIQIESSPNDTCVRIRFLMRKREQESNETI